MIRYFFIALFCLPNVLLAQKQLELKHLTDATFMKESVRGINWMNDGQYYTTLEKNKVVKYNIATGAADSILFDGDKASLKLDAYSFSSDEKKMLLTTEMEGIYRHSYTANFYVYDMKTKELQQLSKAGKQSYATFSPDGTMVAFTRNNNLYYTKLVNLAETQVTTDGEANKIINGSTDWVYEEEFGFTTAFFWSPDSKKLAYYRFDEQKVPEYNMQMWNGASLYPADYRFKYPKAGENNSTIQIKIYDLTKNTHQNVDIGKETDIYIPRVMWTASPATLSVTRLNRLQNKLEILHVDAATGSSTVILTERSKTYIDINYCEELVYLKNGKNFLMSSERHGFKHFYLHTMDGQTVSQITNGKWEATQMVGLDQTASTPILYFISTATSPKDRTLYKVSVKGTGQVALSPASGWTSVNMSPDTKYYIQTYATANTPDVISLVNTKTAKMVRILKDNLSLNKTLSEYNLSKKHFFNVEAEDKSLLDGYMLVPSNLDSTKKHPVLIFQYSGPGSQNVTNNWGGSNYIWHQYLVQQGIIVAVVDTRGTGARGEAFKKMTYKELGKLEVADHIAAAKHLGQMSFIDAERIGIWGWSYGGYMSTLAMLKGADYFKAGIAVAPVTTWRFYDTIYTERYLQRPEDNPSGYDENSPLSHAEKLKGNFLLIHGTGDDNVHFQNAVALQEALINAGKQFDSFYYPDKAHGIGGMKARTHLYQMMTDFLKNKL